VEKGGKLAYGVPRVMGPIHRSFAPPNYGVEKPSWPHVECLDAYVWHPTPARRHCFSHFVFVQEAELVAGVFQGEPIERLLCLRTLLVEKGEPKNTLMRKLFPKCPQCANAAHDRCSFLASAMAIHPDAIPLLRQARPNMNQLLVLDLPLHRRRKAPSERRSKPGLPVRDTERQTREEQISWALEMINDKSGASVGIGA